MNIEQVIVELRKLKPDIPKDRDITGFFIIDDGETELIYLEYDSDDIILNFGELERN